MSRFYINSETEISAAQERRIDAEKEKNQKRRFKQETKELEKKEILAFEVKKNDEIKPKPVKKVKKDVLVTRKEFKRLDEDINSNHIERGLRAQITSENEEIQLKNPKEIPLVVPKKHKKSIYNNQWGGNLQTSLFQKNKKEQVQTQKKSQKNPTKPDIYSIKNLQIYLLKQKSFHQKAIS